jgi:arylsulfatase A-like enzyme
MKNTFAWLASAVLLSSSAPAAPTKPNIIVIFTDDLGYADLGCQLQEKDVLTPNIDRFAKEGARFTAGYATAPQCSPSRAGLLTGRYQQRIGIDAIPDIPLPLEELTIAEMLKPAGYVTGQIGKWHLEPNALCMEWAKKHRPNLKPDEKGRIKIPTKDRIAYFPVNQGFSEFFTGEMDQYYANFTLDGKDREPGFLKTDGFRVDTQTDAALAFIRRHRAAPFFLYLAWFAPHTPLELAEPYVKHFPKDMPLRRRAALSMIAGIDAGMGRILSLLKELNLDDDTLIVFSSDNGAPIHDRRDSPLNTDEGGWDGSLNTPWVGEKGMLSEGGIRVPFLMRWPDHIPAGLVIDTPVSTLDIAPTALAAAGEKAPANLDGVNLLPMLRKSPSPLPPRILHWRFWGQIACRDDRWKYLSVNNRHEFLFDLASDAHETRNLAKEHPEIMERLRKTSQTWAAGLQPPGPPRSGNNKQEPAWYRKYFNLENP